MGEEKDLLENLRQELRRGTLILSVLSQMKEPKYGYALVQSLEEKGVEIEGQYPVSTLEETGKAGPLKERVGYSGSKAEKIL